MLWECVNWFKYVHIPHSSWGWTVADELTGQPSWGHKRSILPQVLQCPPLHSGPWPQEPSLSPSNNNIATKRTGEKKKIDGFRCGLNCIFPKSVY